MKIRDRIITFNVHRLALPLVKLIVPPSKVPFSMEELRAFPAGSMGNDLYHFLTAHGFTLLPYFQSHDVKHVLLGYGTTGDEEGSMQFFYIGNGHYSISSMVSAIASLVMMPEYWGAFYRAFRRGQKAKPLGPLPLECLVFCRTKSLQEYFCIPARETISNAVGHG